MTRQSRVVRAFGLQAALLLAFTQVGLAAALASSDSKVEDVGVGALASVMTPKGQPRVIDFTTQEGTLMSVDLSPDGQWIVFDLLGDIYRMKASGGRAESLTQNSGIALNYHPRYSPDGSRIAFVSDRSGQANIWTMAADGSQPHAVFLDLDHPYVVPVWAPDGQSIVVTRYAPTPGQGWDKRNASIWQLPLVGVPRPLRASTTAQFYASSFAPDGQTLYFYTSSMLGAGYSVFEEHFRLGALSLSSGEVKDVGSIKTPSTYGQGKARPLFDFDASPLMEAVTEIAPVASPDGNYLAFARAQPDQLMEFRGHKFRPRTALFVRDLKTGQDTKVLDPITKDLTNFISTYPSTFLPTYGWSADSRDIVISVGGKIVRVGRDGRNVRALPFQANVHRVISEQVRRREGLGPDKAIPVRFIQWPTASPNGKTLAFAALGRIWRMDLPAGKPAPLTGDPGQDVQITPAWSPDGTKIAFATWNGQTRGRLWTVDVHGNVASKISAEAGEYIWPTWLPGGQIVAVSGPGAADARDAWDAPSGWQVVRFGNDLKPKVLADGGTPRQPLQIGSDGRIYFAKQWDALGGQVNIPYPDDISKELRSWVLMSVDGEGQTPHAHAGFPASPSDFSVPVPSPDGQWIAYQNDYQVFAQKVNVADRAQPLAFVDPHIILRASDRIRLDERGGVYPRWRDAHTVEFADGNRYVSYDVTSGARRTVDVSLTFDRDVGQESVALTNAHIITMDGERIVKSGAIVVRGGRLACVGRCNTNGIARIVDLKGATVIPGLIDVHEHITGFAETSGVVQRRRPASLLALAYGVTTIIDPATSSTTLFSLGEMTEAGRALGPRTLGAAEPIRASVNRTGETDMGNIVTVESQADADYQVSRRANWGAVISKSYEQTRRQQQQWIVEATRARGLSITSEGNSVVADIGMIMDGQTGWEHFMAALPIYSDVAQFLGRAGANYSPTLGVAGAPQGAIFYYGPAADMPHDAKYARFASAGLLTKVQYPDTQSAPIQDFAFPILAEGAADVIRAGGYATIGEHGQAPGIGSHWEIWSYATAMTPLEALRMATLNGARLVGLEQELGSLTVGKRADLVVLRGDPLKDIKHTADIDYVMKSGRLYNADTLEEVVPSPGGAAAIQAPTR